MNRCWNARLKNRMKIGLISDIHGDFPSLVKALRVFQQVKVDKILCAGDLVEKGDRGDEVVALIHKLKIPCVMGNHDEMAPNNQQWLKDNMDITHPNTKKQLLQPETIDIIEQFPRKLRFEWHNLRILLVHGSPTSNVEYLMKTASIKRFAEHARNARADIIICGHTHNPMHYYVDDVHFINPGSVIKGVSSHTCAILTLPEKQVTLYYLETGDSENLIPQTPPIQ